MPQNLVICPTVHHKDFWHRQYVTSGANQSMDHDREAGSRVIKTKQRTVMRPTAVQPDKNCRHKGLSAFCCLCCRCCCYCCYFVEWKPSRLDVIMQRSGLKTKITSTGRAASGGGSTGRRHAKYDIMLEEQWVGRQEEEVEAREQYGGPRKYVHSRQKPS